MRDQHADAGTVPLTKLAPQAFVEAANSVVRVGSGLAVRDAVEKMPVLGPLPPHALHVRGRRLEVTKVLFAEPWLLVYLDGPSLKGRRRRVVRGQCFQYPLEPISSQMEDGFRDCNGRCAPSVVSLVRR